MAAESQTKRMEKDGEEGRQKGAWSRDDKAGSEV
jgi:hypothetical protein